jgi:hypothetical protein
MVLDVRVGESCRASGAAGPRAAGVPSQRRSSCFASGPPLQPCLRRPLRPRSQPPPPAHRFTASRIPRHVSHFALHSPGLRSLPLPTPFRTAAYSVPWRQRTRTCSALGVGKTRIERVCHSTQTPVNPAIHLLLGLTRPSPDDKPSPTPQPLHCPPFHSRSWNPVAVPWDRGCSGTVRSAAHPPARTAGGS